MPQERMIPHEVRTLLGRPHDPSARRELGPVAWVDIVDAVAEVCELDPWEDVREIERLGQWLDRRDLV